MVSLLAQETDGKVVLDQAAGAILTAVDASTVDLVVLCSHGYTWLPWAPSTTSTLSNLSMLDNRVPLHSAQALGLELVVYQRAILFHLGL